jgi:tRNA (guanine-N7-)-methyltransferase
MQEPTDTPRHRAIRSYVLRAGRITQAQQRALEQQWPQFGIEFQPKPLELARLYGRTAPCTLEIGFGNGEHLLERALAQPGQNFLGVEVHRSGIGHLLLAASKAGVTNLRIIEHDAVEVLQLQIGAASLDQVQLLFPDPWPKKRHHKRRIVQHDFVALVASRLAAGGRLHLATDWEPYADEMLQLLNGCKLVTNCAAAGGFLDDDAVQARSATRFQRRGESLGHRVRELLFQRA